MASTVNAMGAAATGVTRLYATVVVAAVPLPVVVTPVTVKLPVAVPSVAATADTNRRLKVVVWAAVAVSVPPERDCVASSVVRTVVVGTPQAATTAKLLLDANCAKLVSDTVDRSPHVPEARENTENNLGLLPAVQSGAVANDLFKSNDGNQGRAR